MKNQISFALCIFCYTSIYSQDLIIKKNGDEIKSKVVEIDDQKIKYKKYENPSGPIYSIAYSDVFIIKYENGTKDILNPMEEKKEIAVNTGNLNEVTKIEPVKKTNSPVKKLHNEKIKTRHFGLSLGLGNAYNTSIGLNLRVLLGSENFALVPNVGFGFISPDESLPQFCFGVRLQSEGYYIGYNYGYVGKKEDYDSFFDDYTTYYTGSTLVFGKEVFFDKNDRFGGHSSIGINLDGFDIDYLSIFTFDLGLVYRF